MGIDPGTIVMGYGLISVVEKKTSIICMGVLRLSKFEDHPLRLRKIFESVSGLVENYHPDELAIEDPFYGKNVQSMLKLGRAQGVAMAAALNRDIPIFEYTPRKIKQSITGNGNASKQQVAAMLQQMLKFDKIPDFLDATDALAVAVCHSYNHFGAGSSTGKKNSSRQTKSYGSWSSFITDNPDRVKK